MYGKAKGMKVKTFQDYTDGSVEEKLNNFFVKNPNVEVLDIKYFNGYGVVNIDEIDAYGRECAMILYREGEE